MQPDELKIEKIYFTRIIQTDLVGSKTRNRGQTLFVEKNDIIVLRITCKYSEKINIAPVFARKTGLLISVFFPNNHKIIGNHENL